MKLKIIALMGITFLIFSCTPRLNSNLLGTAAGGPSGPLNLALKCSTAVVVGLGWNQIASAVNYVLLRNGTQLASTTQYSFSDTTVSATTNYTYIVNAVDAGNNILATSTLQTMTAAATPNGDAPYCQSSLIKSMTWNWANGFNQQNGSDLWPVTWGSDGNIYAFFGDGGGFFGSDSNGRASFGFSMITGSNPVINSTNAKNIFGGLNTSHPSTINGKAGSIISVGANFYAVAGIYRSGESGGPSGSPNHSEIISSLANAYSWQDSSSTFCSSSSSPNTFCPGSFINFGAGNSGAIDNYVYVYGTTAANFFGTTPSTGPANTYLVRVPNNQVTTMTAYQAYAGLDASGNPVWNSDLTKIQPVFTDRGPKPFAIGEAVYNPILKRFIGVAQGFYLNQAAFYEAPNPWGPWSTVAYYNSNADNSGGWGNLGSSTFVSGHGDSLGINFINAWTSSDGLTMWATFSSDGLAPTGALLPSLAGKSFDSFSLVSVTLGQ